MNRQLFYDGYPRVRGLFGNTDCAAEGHARRRRNSAAGAAGAARCPTRCSARCTSRPRPKGPASRCATTCAGRRTLLKQAGWEYRDGALRNAKGEAMVLEYLDSKEGGVRTVSPWIRNLEKLGITLKFAQSTSRCTSSAWTSSSSTSRRSTSRARTTRASNWPTSLAARRPTTESSGNYMGVKSPAVDALVTGMVRRARPRRNCCRPAARSTA